MARPSDFDLAKALAQKNFTPSVRDAQAIVEILGHDDDAVVARAQAALALLGDAGREALERAFDAGISGDGVRARAVQAMGLLARKGDATARTRVLAMLADPGPRVRRAAINALANLPIDDEIRAATIARWDAADVTPDERRTLAEAFGKIGGDAAVERLRSVTTGDDAELSRRRDRALVMTERGAQRGTESEVRVDPAPPSPLAVVLHCKGGLADQLVNELRALSIEALPLRDDEAHIALEGPLSTLFAARLWITLGIRVPRPPGDLETSIVQGMLGARALLAAWTTGPIRWRLEMPSGKQRAVVWRIARDVAAAAPELVNDPAATTWNVRVVDGALELEPMRYADPRFAYRKADVPAASHPTVAAALARIAEPRANDRIWDPFCGSGLELAECAVRSRDLILTGTDLDDRALAAADQNLAAAVAAERAGVTLTKGDSREAVGDRDLDLVITNPPLGSRVHVDAAKLLVEMLPVIARRLKKSGRLVWITPAPQATTQVAERLGLRRMFHIPIDLGGVRGILERWVVK